MGLLHAAGFRRKTLSSLCPSHTSSISFTLSFSLSPPHSPFSSINLLLFFYSLPRSLSAFALSVLSSIFFSINFIPPPPPPLSHSLDFVRRNNHSALNAMGARGRITMAYSFQSYNTEQLAQGLHSPRRSSNFTAAAKEYSLGKW